MAKVENRIAKKLQQFQRKVTQQGNRGLREWAKDVHTRMRELVPYRTGNLHDSIELTVGDKEVEISVDRTKAPYGDDVEFGTHERPAQPYFNPAVEEYREQLPAYVRRQVK